MVPRTILTQLARLRRRERLLGLTWGGARWLALAVIVLAICCLADWTMDRRQDTPWGLRVGFLVGQGLLWGIAALILVLRPLLRRWTYRQLALFVEERFPWLEQRLISTVEFHEPDADTRGMSPQLIGAATRETEEWIEPLRLARLADHRRLRWSASLILPLTAMIAGVVVWRPELVSVLLQRQLLFERDIPRSIQLLALDPEQVAPVGTDVTLRFHARGPISADMRGRVRIDPDGGPSAEYPLVYQGSMAPDAAIFSATVPSAVADFISHAWLADGRTHRPLHVHLEPQPAIIDQRAWLLLPDYVGHRPNGQPYEQQQPHGDIVGLAHARARVAVRTQKPVVEATLELLGSTVRRLPMKLTGQNGAECVFALQPEETNYRIRVRDRYGFTNVEPVSRGIRLVTEETPRVALLPERFPGMAEDDSAEDSEMDGVPVPLGGAVRIAYWCAAPYGLERARLRYRVNDGAWTPLPLGPAVQAAGSGPFDVRRGAFVNSGLRDQVEFYAVPSTDPNRTWSGVEGGGRFDFQTRRIPGLKVGDRLEFYVEAFDRNPDPDREPGRSESRVKAVVTLPQLEQWVRKTVQEEGRIRGLERKQHGVFVETDTDPEEKAFFSEEPPADKIAPRPAVDRQGNEPSTFVRTWQLLGPLPSPDDRGHDIGYAPEQGPLNLYRALDGVRGKVRWRPYTGDTDKVDLEKFFTHSSAGVAYAVCWVYSNRPQPALLATGSDDGIKVWLNHKLALDRHVHREAVPGEDRENIELARGWNEMLVKVDNAFGSWAFFLELRDPQTGGALEGIRVKNTAPTQNDRRFVRGWQVLGPFPNPGMRDHSDPLPPETEPVNVLRDYDGLAGKVRWRPYYSRNPRVELAGFPGRPDNEATVMYAVCWVHSPRFQPVTVATGSHDGIKLWLNRHLLIDKSGEREATAGEDLAQGRLLTGWNELLVKLDSHRGPPAFFLELHNPQDGRPLQGLGYQASPPPGFHLPALTPRTPFLLDWQLLGPFPNEADRGFDVRFPPETDRINVHRSYTGLRRQVRWQRWHGARNMVDFARALGTRDAAIGYAACWVRTEKERPVVLRLGSDDGIKVWVNRKEVLNRHVHRAAAPGQDTVQLTLTRGWNEILVKLENVSNDWQFCLELLDARTRHGLDGVEVELQPPPGALRQPEAARSQMIRSWQLLGPFAREGHDGHHTVYAPETEPTDLRKAYRGLHGPIHWRLHQSRQDYIDLAQFFNHRNVGVGYGLCWIYSPQAGRQSLAIGSNDGIKLWINDRLAFSHDIGRQARPGQDHVQADFQPGWNKVLVKVDNRGNGWGFYFEVAQSEAGQPGSRLRFRATPPGRTRN